MAKDIETSPQQRFDLTEEEFKMAANMFTQLEQTGMEPQRGGLIVETMLTFLYEKHGYQAKEWTKINFVREGDHHVPEGK